MQFDDPEMSSLSTPMMVEWKEILTKASMTGAIATAAAALLIPGGSGSLAGIQIPGSIAVGLGCAGGSVTGDLAHKYVLPHIPQNQKYLKAESAAVSIGAAIGGAYLGMNIISGSVPILTPVLIGGGSFVASDYIYHTVLDKNSGGFVL